MKLTRYILEKQGNVMQKVFGPNHCGTQNHLHGGEIPLRYHIRLFCNARLDSHGFLVDNMTISDFMEAFAGVPTELSCERLTMEIARQMEARAMAEDPGLQLRGMSVSVSPEPFNATISGEFGTCV